MMSMGIIMGGGLGIVYGIADIEGFMKKSINLVYWETFAEIISLAPIGLFIGLVFGLLFGILRAIECHY